MSTGSQSVHRFQDPESDDIRSQTDAHFVVKSPITKAVTPVSSPAPGGPRENCSEAPVVLGTSEALDRGPTVVPGSREIRV
eukprot:4623186-Pyramimonas_sp.AAC.1